MNIKKRSVSARIFEDDKNKLMALSRELAIIQKRDVPIAEIVRRSLNVPDLNILLKKDAEFKRRFGK